MIGYSVKGFEKWLAGNDHYKLTSVVVEMGREKAEDESAKDEFLNKFPKIYSKPKQMHIQLKASKHLKF